MLSQKLLITKKPCSNPCDNKNLPSVVFIETLWLEIFLLEIFNSMSSEEDLSIETLSESCVEVDSIDWDEFFFIIEVFFFVERAVMDWLAFCIEFRLARPRLFTSTFTSGSS